MAFVGRDRELAALAAALQRAADGETVCVAVVGPAGIGISRLLDELEGRIRDVPSVVVARARGHAPWSGVPYRVLGTALGDALDRVPDVRLPALLGTASHDVAALLPSIEARLKRLSISLDPFPLEAPDQRASRVLESVLGVLQRLALDTGVALLVLEDLHAADPGTRSFVEALLRVTAHVPLALVVTYQPDELHRRHPMHQLATQLEGSPLVRTLPVGPLARDELFRLVEDRLGERPPLSVMAAVLEGSRGNPLIATQLVDVQSTLEGVRLSDSFEEIVHAQLTRVERPAARVLRLLAAAGRPLSRPELNAVVLPDGHLGHAAIAQALRSRLAVERRDGLAIVHDLVAEAVEDLALPAERQVFHLALAQLVAEPAEQAWHWEAAARHAAARQSHVAAAAVAEQIEPGETALRHYARALELGEWDASGAPGSADADVLAGAARAAAAAGSFRRAVAFTQQLIEAKASRGVVLLAASRGDPSTARLQEEVGELHERLGRYQWAGGDLVGAVRSFETALELVPVRPSVPRARALASLAQHLMIDGRFADSAAVAEQARDIARRTTPAAVAELAHATCTLGVDVAYLGDLGRGLRLVEEATASARDARRLDDLMRCYANRTTLLDLDSRREEALAVVKEGIAEARRGGLERTYGAFLRGNAADILFQLGRWQEAEIECRAGMEFRPSGVAWFSPILYLALLLVESRADDEAARLVGQAALQLQAVPAGQWTALVMQTSVSLALWRDELEDARALAEREWDRVLATQDPGQIATAASTALEVCAAAAERGRQRRDWGALAAAGALAQRVLPQAEALVASSNAFPPRTGARREAELHLATARAHHARVRGRARPSEWAKLARAWSGVPIPYQAAKASWHQAAATLEGGEGRAPAKAPLLEAWRIASELGARPLARAVADLARRARISLPGAPADVIAEPVERPLVAVGPGRTTQPPERGEAPARGTADHETGTEELTVEQIIALAATPTGRAIGQRLLGHERPDGDDRFGLSPREIQVLRVLAEGRTNREIAERLYISERTVAVHVRHILAKLGVAGRVEAAGLAIRLGLVPSDPLVSQYIGTARRP